MGTSSACFRTDTYQEQSRFGSASEDGKTVKWFTMAHELGHASGLDDEYLEQIEEDNKTNSPADWLTPRLSRFDQYYPGMPYSCDDSSIMNRNLVPRLRHFWYFCRWLNETDAVKALSGNAVYYISYSGSTNYDYFLKDYTKNYYEPVYKEEKVKNGNHGIFDLFLYKVGNDETTANKMIIGMKDFDGILVVRLKLQWFFDSYDGNTWANIGTKLTRIRAFQTDINVMLNTIFFIQCPSEDDFKKVYVYFVPHYYFEGTTISDHFEITVKANPALPVKNTADFMKPGFRKDEFAVDQKEDNFTVMRYILGLAPYSTTTSSVAGKMIETKNRITSITKDDLGFLAEWIKKKRGKGLTYTVMS